MKIWQNSKHKLHVNSYQKDSLSLSSTDFGFFKTIYYNMFSGGEWDFGCYPTGDMINY